MINWMENRDSEAYSGFNLEVETVAVHVAPRLNTIKNFENPSIVTGTSYKHMVSFVDAGRAQK
jgi:hypothetical protein